MLNTGQNIYIVVLWMTLSVTCLVLLNFLWPPSRRRTHNDVIGWQLTVLGTVYAVMIGFMLYAVWANYTTAETNVENETNALVNLFRIAGGLPAAQRDTIHIAAMNYANTVVDDEWPTMARDQMPHTGQMFVMQMWNTLAQTPATTPAQQISLQQAMRELSSLAEHRRIRILDSRSQMPQVLWLVLIFGGIVTIASCCLIGSENRQLHLAMILATSLLISMALVAIGDIDRPFSGSVHVSVEPFIRSQANMLHPNDLQ